MVTPFQLPGFFARRDGPLFIEGRYQIWTIWGSVRTMKSSFVHGYLHCQRAIETEHKLSEDAVRALLEKICAEQEDWKAQRQYRAPPVWRADNVYGSLLIAALLRLLCKASGRGRA